MGGSEPSPFAIKTYAEELADAFCLVVKRDTFSKDAVQIGGASAPHRIMKGDLYILEHRVFPASTTLTYADSVVSAQFYAADSIFHLEYRVRKEYLQNHVIVMARSPTHIESQILEESLQPLIERGAIKFDINAGAKDIAEFLSKYVKFR